MYLTYAEYTDMGGTLEESTFNNLEFQAEVLIDYYTFNRLKKDTTYPEAVKRCVYALITMLKQKQDANQIGQSSTGISNVASQSNDGVSISYNVLSASEVFKSIEKEIPTTIQMYLSGVTNSLGRNLLFRGVYPDE